MTKRLPFAVVSSALLLLAAAPAFADTTSDLVRSLQLIAAPAPVKQRADWREPKKVLLLEVMLKKCHLNSLKLKWLFSSNKLKKLILLLLLLLSQENQLQPPARNGDGRKHRQGEAQRDEAPALHSRRRARQRQAKRGEQKRRGQGATPHGTTAL